MVPCNFTPSPDPECDPDADRRCRPAAVRDGGPLFVRLRQVATDNGFARKYWRWCCGRPSRSDPFAEPESMSFSRR